MQTNVLIKGECILRNKKKSCPYKKVSVFYNGCLETFGPYLVYDKRRSEIIMISLNFLDDWPCENGWLNAEGD